LAIWNFCRPWNDSTIRDDSETSRSPSYTLTKCCRLFDVMIAILADARRASLAGDWATAESLLRRALAELPQDHEARLELGELLERRGEHDAALIQYARALQDAQALGLWMNRDSTPGPLQPRVEHAVSWVRDHRGAAIATLLDPLAKQYGTKSLRRIERCLRIYFGEEAPPYLDARQQPTFLYVPEVPPATYFNRAMFRWIDALEEQTDAIRTELQALLPTATSRERVFDSDELEGAEPARRGRGAELERLLLLSPRRAAAGQLRCLPRHCRGPRRPCRCRGSASTARRCCSRCSPPARICCRIAASRMPDWWRTCR
jgi:tetratricopeptide (TPR) repeat protein